MLKYIFLAIGVFSILLPDFATAQELEIPRFASFRHNETNMRRGPSKRYPIQYVYKVQHYPVEIIDEHDLWRQIRENDGTTGWVHLRTLSGVRYVMMTKDDTLYKEPDTQSQPIAYVQTGSLAKLEECPEKSEFCEIMFTYENKKYEGWMLKESFYGTYPHEVIH